VGAVPSCCDATRGIWAIPADPPGRYQRPSYVQRGYHLYFRRACPEIFLENPCTARAVPSKRTRVPTSRGHADQCGGPGPGRRDASARTPYHWPLGHRRCHSAVAGGKWNARTRLRIGAKKKGVVLCLPGRGAPAGRGRMVMPSVSPVGLLAGPHESGGLLHEGSHGLDDDVHLCSTPGIANRSEYPTEIDRFLLPR